MPNSIKEFTDQMDCIKTWCRSIVDQINSFPVSDLMDSNKCIELINSIDSEIQSIEIHNEHAKDIINNRID
jgi:hypothetical protein